MMMPTSEERRVVAQLPFGDVGRTGLRNVRDVTLPLGPLEHDEGVRELGTERLDEPGVRLERVERLRERGRDVRRRGRLASELLVRLQLRPVFDAEPARVQ